MGDCPPCTSYQMGPQIHQCYHSMRKDFTCAHRSCFPKPAATCDNIHVTDNCPVCLRYNCYFSKSHDDSDTRKSVDNKQRYHRNLSNDREYCCCVNRLDSTSDTQEESMRWVHRKRNKFLEQFYRCVIADWNPKLEIFVKLERNCVLLKLQRTSKSSNERKCTDW